MLSFNICVLACWVRFENAMQLMSVNEAIYNSNNNYTVENSMGIEKDC